MIHRALALAQGAPTIKIVCSLVNLKSLRIQEIVHRPPQARVRQPGNGVDGLRIEPSEELEIATTGTRFHYIKAFLDAIFNCFVVAHLKVEVLHVGRSFRVSPVPPKKAPTLHNVKGARNSAPILQDQQGREAVCERVAQLLQATLHATVPSPQR
jgi:hypothetical protein